MKCIECNQKVNIRNIQRLCKSKDHEDHVYCKSCYENIKKETNDIIYCKGENCNSIIYKKELKDNNKDDIINKYFLSTTLLISHLGLISNQVK